MSGSGARSDIGTQIGRYEDALAWVGRRSELRKLDVAVDESRCKYFAALCEDGSPAYWDTPWATERYGAPLAPSGLVMSLIMPLPWKPGAPPAPATLAMDVPLPGTTFINVDTDCEFIRPIRWGDHLSLFEEVVDISTEKNTRLGRGHFVTTCMHLLDAGGHTVARLTNVLYRYEKAA